MSDYNTPPNCDYFFVYRKPADRGPYSLAVTLRQGGTYSPVPRDEWGGRLLDEELVKYRPGLADRPGRPGYPGDYPWDEAIEALHRLIAGTPWEDAPIRVSASIAARWPDQAARLVR